ncbi:TetR/AcrR family transcriptional regulator [Gordonia sp. NPDC003376]
MNHDVAASERRGRGRPAGDGANRAAILDAAKVMFGAHGYDGASMRAIAAAAGVDPGMIRHFFTDKHGLFAATIADRTEFPSRMAAAFAGDRAHLGERVAAAYLGAWEDEATAPILRAIVRTALTSERTANVLRAMFATMIIAELPSDMADIGQLPLRFALAGSHLLGVAVARNLGHIEALATIDHDHLIAILAPVIQAYLTGPLPAGTDPS